MSPLPLFFKTQRSDSYTESHVIRVVNRMHEELEVVGVSHITVIYASATKMSGLCANLLESSSRHDVGKIVGLIPRKVEISQNHDPGIKVHMITI